MKRKVSEILFFIQGGVIFFLIGFLIVMNCMDYALPYVWTCVTVVVLSLVVISLLCIYNVVYKKEQMAEQSDFEVYPLHNQCTSDDRCLICFSSYIYRLDIRNPDSVAFHRKSFHSQSNYNRYSQHHPEKEPYDYIQNTRARHH